MRGLTFDIPNIVGRAYAPGPQPHSPGNSHLPWDAWNMRPIPWPKAVPVLRVLASDPGTPRERGGQPFINRIATQPGNYLTLGGVAMKSQG